MYCANLECPDFQLFGRHGEYAPEITRCPKCGTELVTEMPAQGPPAPDSGTDQTIEAVGRYTSRQGAEVAASFLEAHGIRAFVSGDDAGGAYPATGFARGFQLLVRVSRSRSARDLLGPGDLDFGQDEDLVPVMACDDRHEAETAKTYLESKGIPASIQADDGDAAFPNQDSVNEVRLCVPETDFDRAVDLLEEAGFFTDDISK